MKADSNSASETKQINLWFRLSISSLQTSFHDNITFKNISQYIVDVCIDDINMFAALMLFFFTFCSLVKVFVSLLRRHRVIRFAVRLVVLPISCEINKNRGRGRKERLLIRLFNSSAGVINSLINLSPHQQKLIKLVQL